MTPTSVMMMDRGSPRKEALKGKITSLYRVRNIYFNSSKCCLPELCLTGKHSSYID